MTSKEEYIDFLDSDQKIPDAVDRSIFESQSSILKPLKSGVVIGSIQFLACALTLLVCPQFGFGAVMWGEDVVHHILHQSPLLCGAYCGVVFLGCSSLLTAFILPKHYLSAMTQVGAVKWSVAAAMLMSVLTVSRLFIGPIEVELGYLFSWAAAAIASYFFVFQWAGRKRLKSSLSVS